MPKNEISIGRIQQLVGAKEINAALMQDEMITLRTRISDLEAQVQQLKKELHSCKNTDTSPSE